MRRFPARLWHRVEELPLLRLAEEFVVDVEAEPVASAEHPAGSRRACADLDPFEADPTHRESRQAGQEGFK